MENWPKWLWPVVIGGFVIVLVVVALVREPVQLDPTTPEGTVQVYLQAISDGDFAAALEVLDEETLGDCSAADIQRSVWQEDFTASLPDEPSDQTDGTVFVDVTMRFGNSGVVGGGWESRETFVLVEHDGVWWITEDPWPYFSYECREEGF